MASATRYKISRPYSWEELCERTESGLCLFCDEPEVGDHHLQHKNLGLLMIEPDDDQICVEDVLVEPVAASDSSIHHQLECVRVLQGSMDLNRKEDLTNIVAEESAQKIEITTNSQKPKIDSSIPDSQKTVEEILDVSMGKSPTKIDIESICAKETGDTDSMIQESGAKDGTSINMIQEEESGLEKGSKQEVSHLFEVFPYNQVLNSNFPSRMVDDDIGLVLKGGISDTQLFDPGGIYCAIDCVRRRLKLSRHGPGMSLHIENALNIYGLGVEKNIYEVLQSHTVYSNVPVQNFASLREMLKEWDACVVSKNESGTHMSIVCEMEPGPFRECDFLVRNMDGRLALLEVSVHAESGTSMDHSAEHDDMALQTNKTLLPIVTEINSVVELSKKMQRQEMSKGNTKQEEGEGIFSVEVHVLKQYPVLSQIARFFAQLHASNKFFVDFNAVVKTLVHQFVDSSVLVNQTKMATATFQFNSVSLLIEHVALAAASLRANTRTQLVANNDEQKVVDSVFLQLQCAYWTRFKLKSEERVACWGRYSEILFKILFTVVETSKQPKEMNLESMLLEIAKLVSQLFTPNVMPQEEEVGVVMQMAEYDKEQRQISEAKAQHVHFTLLQHLRCNVTKRQSRGRFCVWHRWKHKEVDGTSKMQCDQDFIPIWLTENVFLERIGIFQVSVTTVTGKSDYKLLKSTFNASPRLLLLREVQQGSIQQLKDSDLLLLNLLPPNITTLWLQNGTLTRLFWFPLLSSELVVTDEYPGFLQHSETELRLSFLLAVACMNIEEGYTVLLWVNLMHVPGVTLGLWTCSEAVATDFSYGIVLDVILSRLACHMGATNDLGFDHNRMWDPGGFLAANDVLWTVDNALFNFQSLDLEVKVSKRGEI